MWILMSDSISIKKLKRIMYSALRWRLQLPNYYPHNPIPPDGNLGTFSQGVKCAYRDLLEEIEKIEQSENQRGVWKKKRNLEDFAYWGEDVDIEVFMDEIKRHE